jgi:hypothetical protein
MMDADAYIAAFNAAVEAGDYADFLRRLTDDAVVRFENVPGVGVLEYDGRPSYTAAYEQQPPDDQMDIAGPVEQDGAQALIPFAWRRDGRRGTILLTLDNDLISRMVVVFG